MRQAMRVLLLVVLLSPPAYAGSGDVIKLDGVLYESDKPETSIAIINGEPIKLGESYEGNVLDKIEKDSVVLRPKEGGAPITLRLWGAPHSTKPAAADAAQATTASQLPPGQAAAMKVQSQQQAAASEIISQIPKEVKDRPGMKEALTPTGGMPFNVAGMLNYSMEVKALGDLRQISTATMVAANEEDFGPRGELRPPTLTFEQLKQKGFLPEGFRTTSGPYTYTIRSTGYGKFEVHADPNDAGSSLRHFMADQDGILYAEHGRAATTQSAEP